MQAIVSAYSKINLFLDVLGKRDDGYHEVAMIMQSIKLADFLSLKPWEENTLVCSNRFLPLNENNLAMQALLLMQKEFPHLPPIRINLEKFIPVAAGLAGGSSDAAAVIMGLNRMFQLNLAPDELAVLAGQIGSDVPFCLSGPTALAGGRGEILKPLTALPHMYVVLAKPAFGVSTAQVYKNLQAADYATHPSIEEYIAYIEQGDTAAVGANLYNVLEKSTFRLQPKVADIKRTFKTAGADYCLMSGSGPTVYALFNDKPTALNFYRKLKGRYKNVFLSESLTPKSLDERVTLRE